MVAKAAPSSRRDSLISLISRARLARLCGALFVLLGWQASTPTFAAEYWVESVGMASRADAELLAQGLDLPDGALAVRVVRRFLRGQGWLHQVRVEGLPSQAAGEEVALQIQRLGSRAIVMERDEDVEMKIFDTGAPAKATAVTGSSAPTPRSSRAMSPQSILKQAADAHGGEKGGYTLVSHAAALRFEFERTLLIDGQELVTNNLLQRQGEAMRMDVEVVRGPGVSSTTVISAAGQAAVQVEAEVVARDAARVREVLARFTPEEVLAIPLGLAMDVEEAATWQDLVLADGGPADEVTLRPFEAGRDGLVEVTFRRPELYLNVLSWRGPAGLMTWRFEDYVVAAPGLVYPRRVTVHRGGSLVERVEVKRLEVNPTFGPDVFVLP